MHRRRPIVRHVFPAALLVVALGAVGGCVPQQARDHARMLAALTERVRADGERFASSRQELDLARQQNTDVLEANALEAEQSARHALDVWRIAGADREAGVYAQLRDAADAYAGSLKEAADLRERQRRDLESLRTAVHVRSDELAATASALSQLSEPPDFSSQVKFFIAYGKAVRDQVRKANEDAEKQLDEGKEVAEDQATAVADAAAADRAKSGAVRRASAAPRRAATQPAAAEPVPPR